MFLEILAALCAVVAYVLIIRDMLRTEVSMNIATWVIWAILDGIAFYSAWTASDRIPWMIGVFTMGAAIIAFLSLKNGTWRLGKTEWFCIGAVGISFLLWQFGPTWVLVASTLAMFIGGIPQLMDAYRDSLSQSKLNWGLFLMSNGLSLIGANQAIMGEWFYPLVGVAFNAIMMGILVYAPKRAL